MKVGTYILPDISDTLEQQWAARHRGLTHIHRLLKQRRISCSGSAATSSGPLADAVLPNADPARVVPGPDEFLVATAA